jgi:hypothetical protein
MGNCVKEKGGCVDYLCKQRKSVFTMYPGEGYSDNLASRREKLLLNAVKGRSGASGPWLPSRGLEACF